jgi:hypothetical protein
MARQAKTSRTQPPAGARQTARKSTRKSAGKNIKKAAAADAAKSNAAKTAVATKARPTGQRKAVKARSATTSKARPDTARRGAEASSKAAPPRAAGKPPVADTAASDRPAPRIRLRVIPITNGGTQVGPGTEDDTPIE